MIAEERRFFLLAQLVLMGISVVVATGILLEGVCLHSNANVTFTD